MCKIIITAICGLMLISSIAIAVETKNSEEINKMLNNAIRELSTEAQTTTKKTIDKPTARKKRLIICRDKNCSIEVTRVLSLCRFHKSIKRSGRVVKGGTKLYTRSTPTLTKTRKTHYGVRCQSASCNTRVAKGGDRCEVHKFRPTTGNLKYGTITKEQVERITESKSKRDARIARRTKELLETHGSTISVDSIEKQVKTSITNAFKQWSKPNDITRDEFVNQVVSDYTMIIPVASAYSKIDSKIINKIIQNELSKYSSVEQDRIQSRLNTVLLFSELTFGN